MRQEEDRDIAQIKQNLANMIPTYTGNGGRKELNNFRLRVLRYCQATVRAPQHILLLFVTNFFTEAAQTWWVTHGSLLDISSVEALLQELDSQFMNKNEDTRSVKNIINLSQAKEKLTGKAFDERFMALHHRWKR